MKERMNLNMEELEAVSGGLWWFTKKGYQQVCDHPSYKVSSEYSHYDKEEGTMYQWLRCTVCGYEEWVPVTSNTEGYEEDLFAPAAEK